MHRVPCHSTGFQFAGAFNNDSATAGQGPFGYACDTCHEYPGSPTNEWPSYNGHSVRADFDKAVYGIGTQNYLKHLNVATAYDRHNDTFLKVTSDMNLCGRCHPASASTYHDGLNETIYLQPNGSGLGPTGGPFTITQIHAGASVQCYNVKCHFNRTTPNWY